MINKIEYLKNRCKQLILGWGFVGFIYTLSNQSPFPVTILQENKLDELIEFDVRALVWYLSFFIYIPLAYLLTPYKQLANLRRAMQISAVFAGFIFFFYPTSIAPVPLGDGLMFSTMGLLQRFDSAKNCLPSLHAALTVIAAWALVHMHQTWRQKLLAVFFSAWAALIIYSIIQTRRHLSLDVGCGIVLGVLAIFLSHKIQLKGLKHA